MMQRWLLLLDNVYRTWPASTWFVTFCVLIIAVSISSGGRL